MINQVRNTVLAIVNKNNYGYITPADFNLYAEQAKLDLFEDYFYQFNVTVNLENTRRSGSSYADIKKGIEEVIDGFSVTANLTQDANNVYLLPVENLPPGGAYYLVNKIIYNNTEVERVNQSKITYLLYSNLTAPTTMFPAYTLEGNKVTIYPSSIQGATDISAQYIRYPFTPKWTYQTLSGGEALFDPNQADFQDFELPISDMYTLVTKILQYAGISIREKEVYQFAQAEQIEQDKQENQTT